MKYLCLCHYDRAKFAACRPEDFQAVGAICAPRDKELQATGQVEAIGSFVEESGYATIRARDDGQWSVERSPYASGPEPWGAFFIVEADSLEQAVDIASLHPGAHLGDYFGGGIEVRPCNFFWQPGD